MKTHQLSIVLPSKSRLVQLRTYTCYTKTCFFLGVTCYFSRMTYFWSFVLFRCNDFIRSLFYFWTVPKTLNSTTYFLLDIYWNLKRKLAKTCCYRFFMSVVLPFLLRLVRVICLVIFEAKIISPFAYFLFHDMCRRQKQKWSIN
jgi:hypothetical protein